MLSEPARCYAWCDTHEVVGGSPDNAWRRLEVSQVHMELSIGPLHVTAHGHTAAEARRALIGAIFGWPGLVVQWGVVGPPWAPGRNVP